MDLEEKVKNATLQHALATSYNDKVKEKAEKLKKKLRKDLALSESDYMEILSEVHECENELKNAKDNMQKSKTKFLEAHGTTLEVLKVSSEIEISDERFNKKGDRKYQCIFCTMQFDRWELRKYHIFMYHWSDMDDAVSIVKMIIIIFMKFNM